MQVRGNGPEEIVPFQRAGLEEVAFSDESLSFAGRLQDFVALKSSQQQSPSHRRRTHKRNTARNAHPSQCVTFSQHRPAAVPLAVEKHVIVRVRELAVLFDQLRKLGDTSMDPLSTVLVSLVLVCGAVIILVATGPTGYT